MYLKFEVDIFRNKEVIENHIFSWNFPSSIKDDNSDKWYETIATYLK
jgi:hypothetical protein